MDTPDSIKPGSDSQDSDGMVPPGVSPAEFDKATVNTSKVVKLQKLLPSRKGVENAKKRLRAFSIQKKTPITPINVAKVATTSTGSPTVLIGKLTGVKIPPKIEMVDPEKKPPKPPKPGSNRVQADSYSDLQKRTQSEIEDMKRKMELVDLGIPLGLICPAPNSDKAMPTKAMPPIKSFLDPSKVDELIREAKKARAEGREFKFDYQKLLPDYDNPFQRKRDEEGRYIEKDGKYIDKMFEETDRKDRDKRKSEKYDKRHDYRDRDRHKDDRRYRDKSEKRDRNTSETNVNLNDYLVCDSWSLDNDDTKSASPKIDENMLKFIPMPKDNPKSAEHVKETLTKPDKVESPKTQPRKMEKLQPVMDAFKYEIDPNEDEMLDIFDEESNIDKYAIKTVPKKDNIYDSPNDKLYDYNSSKDTSLDGTVDDSFLESVINEINQEMGDDSQEKGLVEYDLSPPKKSAKNKDVRESVTPEMDDRMRDFASSQRSDYSDGYRSMESGYKSTESGYKTDGGRSDSFRLSSDKEVDPKVKMSKTTVDSLETWSFVLKICQPLLFRHDKNKCYRETESQPKVWFAVNPKLCACVKDRAVVYDELEACKMALVDHVYGCDQIEDTYCPKSRGWYPRLSQWLSPYVSSLSAPNEWEADESQTDTPTRTLWPPRRTATPQRNDEVCLDTEYQRFMQAVWPEVADGKVSRSTTPVRQEPRKKKAEEHAEDDRKKVKKVKLSLSENWSQESEVEEEPEKSKKSRMEKEKARKRRHSSTSLSDSETDAKSKKKSPKTKVNKKSTSKSAKRRRLNKKYLKKLKDKQKKNKKMFKVELKKESPEDDSSEEQKKKDKKAKKKLKLKKKAQKKKKKDSSSSSDSSSDSSSESDSEEEKKNRKKKKGVIKKKNKKKRKSSSESQSEELFDVNILNNIKTERLTDDEKNKKIEFSPRKKPREIINVKELQSDFVGNNIHIKKEIEEGIKTKVDDQLDSFTELQFSVEKNEEVTEDMEDKEPENKEEVPEESEERETLFKEPLEPQDRVTPQLRPPIEESNHSQSSSQESVSSKEQAYEKDESHLRPSSQNSNYSFNDVIASQGLYQKGLEEDKFTDNYDHEHGNYEMYEHLAMAYQSDVANQALSPPGGARPIETVVRARSRGEIKCDWRAPPAPPAGPAPPAAAPARPSRWGLKPSEVNIVLTGGEEPQESQEPPPVPPVPPPRSPVPPPRSLVPPPGSPPPAVYRIQSLANRTDSSNSGYDEAYQDMYGASDRLQYGDCFATVEAKQADGHTHTNNTTIHTSSLDARIDDVLKNSVLGDVASEADDNDADKDNPDKGILVTKSLNVPESKGPKRVSFADGYKPGQDSDVEEPPKKKKKSRRLGCAWPCPATHPDHVPLWDALPPPPPPPGSPPPLLPLPPQPNPLATHLPRPLSSQMPNPLTGQLPNPLSGQIPNQMLGQLPNPLPGQLPQMTGQLPQMTGQLPQMTGQLPQMTGQLPQMTGQLPQMTGQLANALPGQLPNPLSIQLPRSLSNLPGFSGPAMSMPGMGPLRPGMGKQPLLSQPPHQMKFDPSTSIPGFMPPEPPPGLISFS